MMNIDFASRASGRTVPESGWRGDGPRVQAQRRLHRDAAWIFDQRGLISLGRSLLVVGEVDEVTIAELFDAYRRVLVVSDVAGVDRLQAWSRRVEISFDDAYALHLWERDEVVGQTRLQDLSDALPPGHTLHELRPNVPSATINGIQSLHEISGLDPLPEPFLREDDDGVVTFYATAPSGQVVGCGTVQSLASAGEPWAGTSLCQSVCLHPSLKGSGLGLRLIRHSTAVGAICMGSERVGAVVATKTAPSRKIGDALECPWRVAFIRSKEER